MRATTCSHMDGDNRALLFFFEFYPQTLLPSLAALPLRPDLHKTVPSDQTQQPLRKLIHMQERPQTTPIIFANIDAESLPI